MNDTEKKSSFFLARAYRAFKSLVMGMRVTFHYLVHPKTVVTQQYPENRDELKMFDRFRAQLTMNHDDQGFHKCTACTFCQQACPNGSILVNFREKPALAKTELDTLLWRMDSCTFCNACVLVCPFSVLKFQPNFEGAVFDRRLLVYNMSRYAGPAASVLMKVEDPAERAKAMEPRTPYSGPIPMRGKRMAGLAALDPESEDGE